MTEDEAKTKDCCGPRPLVTAALLPHDPTVSQKVIDRSTSCVGSRCMAWRWSEEKRTAAFLQAVVEHMKATGENFNKATQEVVKRREEFAHTEGFCGLAGQP